MNFTLEKIRPKTKYDLKVLICETIELYGYECDLNFIDTSLINNMSHLFSDNRFNDDLRKFNGDISKWDVSNVTSMRYMFSFSKFNEDINKWSTNAVTDMSYMFQFSELERQNKLPKWYKN